VATFLLAFGIADVARGIDNAGGLIGSGDLLATGATVMAAALLSGVALARQAARPARNLRAEPHP
jgi:adhesin HecA-like repeat protein